MRSLLTRLGHHVVIATNGEAVLESWLAARSAGTPYDLILMDIQMPQLDGVEAAKRIRLREAGEPGRRTPILALTANAMTHQLAEYRAAGMDGLVPKPIEVGVLFGAMQEALDAPAVDAPCEAAHCLSSQSTKCDQNMNLIASCMTRCPCLSVASPKFGVFTFPVVPSKPRVRLGVPAGKDHNGWFK